MWESRAVVWRDFSKRRWKSAPFADFHGRGIFHQAKAESWILTGIRQDPGHQAEFLGSSQLWLRPKAAVDEINCKIDPMLPSFRSTAASDMGHYVNLEALTTHAGDCRLKRYHRIARMPLK
jgi:hypothetical protein